ncbi:hypothetical protein L6452_32503 [Arctium lappa]|uniref:Uncharacterized protein n=1 Tax=Arctium lappa TaxID=4217 RepID=A0ACB8Z557_ARCLA|nr:hypothetical protein L6452_32503 [Arctium lappa]
MIGDRGLFSVYKEKHGGGSVTFGDNKKGQIKSYGVIANGDIDVNRVAYVDGLKHILLSVSQLCDNGLDVMFKKQYYYLFKEDTTTELLRAKIRGDLYLMHFKSINKYEKLCLVSSKNEEAWLWHNRFCHLNFHTLDKLVKLELVKGLPSIKFDRDHLCSACEMGKLKRAAHKTKTDKSCTIPLQMLHVDLCGPISVQNLGEFKNSKIEAYPTTEGFSQNFSASRTPQQNGVVERKNRTLVEAAKTMLTASGLPISFWAEAISTACFTQNRSLVVKRHAKTPYHLLNQRNLNIKYFHVFSCRCFVLNDREQIGKFSLKADEAKFVTSEQISSGLKLQDKESGDSSRANELHHLFEEMFNDDGPSEDDHRASGAETSIDQSGTSLSGPSNTSPSSTTFAGENVEGEYLEDNTEQGSMINQDRGHLQDISEGSTPEQSENSEQGTTELMTSTQSDQSPVTSTNDLSTTEGDQLQET